MKDHCKRKTQYYNSLCTKIVDRHIELKIWYKDMLLEICEWSYQDPKQDQAKTSIKYEKWSQLSDQPLS